MSAPLIEGELRRVLLRHSLEAAPNEVGGIIHRGVVYLLKNHAEQPTDTIEMHREDLRKLIQFLEIRVEDIEDDVIIWHSHPAGGVGPSTIDMQNRTPVTHHLVVAIVDGDIVPTWY